MAIWEFGDYDKETLDEILGHYEALEELGMQADEDMMRELRSEQHKRAEEAY